VNDAYRLVTLHLRGRDLVIRCGSYYGVNSPCEPSCWKPEDESAVVEDLLYMIERHEPRPSSRVHRLHDIFAKVTTDAGAVAHVRCPDIVAFTLGALVPGTPV